MKKKKILFIYAGGTIGQIPKTKEVPGNGNQIVLFPPETEAEFKSACLPIIERLEEASDMEVDFELFATKDSSNMFPEDWTRLAKRVQKAQETDCYDAVGIAHGTDTLTYTANALAFALHGSDSEKSGLQIPVVLTGAQNTIYADGGDGQFNLENLLRVINKCIDEGVADVLINFWSRVLRATRSTKVSEKEFDAFRSPAYPDVGVINSLGVKLMPEFLKKKSEASYSMSVAPEFGLNVFTIDLTPGLLPENVLSIVECNDIKALILKSHGEGNVPTEGEHNFVPLIERLTDELGIPVIITTKFIGGYVGAAHYETGLRAIEAGAIPGLDHTSIAVEVKARWLLGNGLADSVESFKRAMQTSYAGEVTV